MILPTKSGTNHDMNYLGLAIYWLQTGRYKNIVKLSTYPTLIITIIIYSLRVFQSALADGLSLKFELKQVSSNL